MGREGEGGVKQWEEKEKEEVSGREEKEKEELSEGKRRRRRS